LISAASVLCLTGCFPSLPAASHPVDPPQQTNAPVDFTAIAEVADELLLDYWAAVEEVYESGGAESDALSQVAVPETVLEEQAVAQSHAEKGITVIPRYSSHATQFERLFLDGDTVYLVVTTCIDSSNVGIVDDAGNEQLMGNTPIELNEITIEVNDAAFTDLRIARWGIHKGAEC